MFASCAATPPKLSSAPRRSTKTQTRPLPRSKQPQKQQKQQHSARRSSDHPAQQTFRNYQLQYNDYIFTVHDNHRQRTVLSPEQRRVQSDRETNRTNKRKNHLPRLSDRREGWGGKKKKGKKRKIIRCPCMLKACCCGPPSFLTWYSSKTTTNSRKCHRTLLMIDRSSTGGKKPNKNTHTYTKHTNKQKGSTVVTTVPSVQIVCSSGLIRRAVTCSNKKKTAHYPKTNSHRHTR